jgi:hypothetical protein
MEFRCCGTAWKKRREAAVGPKSALSHDVFTARQKPMFPISEKFSAERAPLSARNMGLRLERDYERFSHSAKAVEDSNCPDPELYI